jgi:methylglutaconyl-CoA hydratase
MSKGSFETIKVSVEAASARVTLARPEVKNAFDEHMIADLTGALRELGSNEEIRVVRFTGEGDAFSAGADLHWMKKMARYDYNENLEDAMALADLLETLYTLPKATISMVNGPAIGGGVGLVAACDIAIASRDAFFSLSEARLGLVPACIAPYVIRRIGERYAREYFLTGKRFDAAAANEMGLVNRVVSGDELEDEALSWEKNLLACGPEAVRSCKELIARCSRGEIADLKEFTADMIASLRVSGEGQEGMSAFFEKRLPAWRRSGE